MVSEDDVESAADSTSSPRKPRPVPLMERILLPMVFILFIFMRAIDRVFLYRVLKIMEPYAGTLMSLYWPPMVQCMTVLVAALYVAKRRFMDGDSRYGAGWFSPFSVLASGQGKVPLLWMAQMAFWDQLNAVISAPPSPFIPLVLQTPLNNMVVVFTAAVAFSYLKTRFKAVHYAGITLIILACFTGVLVELQGPPDIICEGLSIANATLSTMSPSSNVTEQVSDASSQCVKGLPPYKDAGGNIIYIPFGTLSVMYFMYVAAILPSAFCNCYKQKKLKQVNLDVMWASLWCGNFQVLWGIAMYPLEWVPWPTPDGHNTKSPSTLGSDLAESWMCFTGIDPKPSVTSCSADSASFWFIWYLLFNVFYNLLFMWLIKKLSGTWASIGSILCGNICGVMSQFTLFAGESAQMLTMEQWDALALSSVALWVYNIEDEVDITGSSVYGEKEGGDHRYDDHGVMGLEDNDSEYSSGDEPDGMSHGIL